MRRRGWNARNLGQTETGVICAADTGGDAREATCAAVNSGTAGDCSSHVMLVRSRAISSRTRRCCRVQPRSGGAAIETFAGWSIPNSLAARVRDHDKLNLDRAFTNPRDLGYHRCKPGQHKTCNHLMREAVRMHQTLGDAARNPGQPSQGLVFVGCHLIFPPERAHQTIKEKVTRIWTADYRQHRGLGLGDSLPTGPEADRQQFVLCAVQRRSFRTDQQEAYGRRRGRSSRMLLQYHATAAPASRIEKGDSSRNLRHYVRSVESIEDRPLRSRPVGAGIISAGVDVFLGRSTYPVPRQVTCPSTSLKGTSRA
jgi:hypothetical protein